MDNKSLLVILKNIKIVFLIVLTLRFLSHVSPWPLVDPCILSTQQKRLAPGFIRVGPGAECLAWPG